MRIFQTVRLSPFAGTLHWTWLNRWILSDIDVFPALNYLLKLRLILGEIFIPSGNVFNLAPMMPIDARVKHFQFSLLVGDCYGPSRILCAIDVSRRGGYGRQYYVVAGTFQLVGSSFQIRRLAGQIKA